MKLEQKLAYEMVRTHPVRSAGLLEKLPLEESTRLLVRVPAKESASVLRRMSPQFAAAVLDALDEERIVEILEVLPVGVASRLTRRLAPERRESVLERVTPTLSRALRALHRYPEGSAGAMMDPNVLALPEDFTARQALERVRETPVNARYNLYVVDRDHRLVGVVNLREVLLANPRARLADFMIRQPKRLNGHDDRSVIIAHPGWRQVHSLPVVDEEGAYLGAVRFRTLRAIEDELTVDKAADADTRQALAQLFAAGAGGLIDALTTPVTGKEGSR